MSSTTLEYTETVNILVKKGFAMMAVAKTPHVPMIDLIPILLTKNETYLNATFGRIAAPTNRTVVDLLTQLSDVLPRLPSDVPTYTFKVVNTVLIIHTTIAVGLRFYSRKCIKPKQLRLEDWSSLVSLIVLFMLHVHIWMEVVYGRQGRHLWYYSLWQYRNLSIRLFTGQMIYYTSHLTIKTSFIIVFYRLFASPLHRFATCSVGVFVFCLTVIGVFGTIFQCTPIDFWNHFATRKCIDTRAFYLSRGIVYSLSDVMIVALPIPGILRLKVSRKEKIMLIGLFGLGIFVTIASVIRLLALWKWFSSADFFYVITVHNTWGLIELNLGLVILCAPALKVLFFNKNSPVATISSMVAKNWSKHGTFRPFSSGGGGGGGQGASQFSGASTWRNEKKKMGKGDVTLETIPESISTTKSSAGATTDDEPSVSERMQVIFGDLEKSDAVMIGENRV